MKIYNYSEARQNFSTVLNTALKDEVIISRKDGSKFRITSINDGNEKKSPLENINGIDVNIPMEDIVMAIRESRER